MTILLFNCNIILNNHIGLIINNNIILNNYNNCRGSRVLLYFATLKVVCLTLDTWWSLLTPVVCQIIKYV